MYSADEIGVFAQHNCSVDANAHPLLFSMSKMSNAFWCVCVTNHLFVGKYITDVWNATTTSHISHIYI
jgi:hypothetical protein